MGGWVGGWVGRWVGGDLPAAKDLVAPVEDLVHGLFPVGHPPTLLFLLLLLLLFFFVLGAGEYGGEQTFVERRT